MPTFPNTPEGALLLQEEQRQAATRFDCGRPGEYDRDLLACRCYVTVDGITRAAVNVDRAIELGFIIEGGPDADTV